MLKCKCMRLLSANKFRSFWLLEAQNINNKREKYGNISELSSDKSYILLDSVENGN